MCCTEGRCLAREVSCSNVGSALCSSSSFKHSTQPSCAAMSTGVAPVSALAWCMSALCSTSYRTTSPWPPFAAKHIGSRIGPSSPGADGSAPSSSDSLHATSSRPFLTAAQSWLSFVILGTAIPRRQCLLTGAQTYAAVEPAACTTRGAVWYSAKTPKGKNG